MATVTRDPDVLDDRHYQDGEEVPADEKVEFALDGKHFEIDLTTEHAEEFRAKFAPEIDVATEVTPRRRPSGGGGGGNKKSNASRAGRELTQRIRTWAESQGITLNPQGRIPNETREAYFAAHPNERPQD